MPTANLSEPNHLPQPRVADAFFARVGHSGHCLVYLQPAVEVEEQGFVRLRPCPIVVESTSLTSFCLVVGSGYGQDLGSYEHRTLGPEWRRGSGF